MRLLASSIDSSGEGESLGNEVVIEESGSASTACGGGLHHLHGRHCIATGEDVGRTCPASLVRHYVAGLAASKHGRGIAACARIEDESSD